MDAVISPYHLTTREAPALVALLLCDRAVTLLPVPRSGLRGDAESLAHIAPRYARVVDSWRWTIPLWNEGVLESGNNGHEPGDDVRAVHHEVFENPAWAALRPVIESALADEPADSIEALAHDLLRGGPNPALCIPVAAGLDRFASRHGLFVARSTATSLSQKFEEDSGRVLGGITIPVILQGRGERLVDARRALEPELADLRVAFAAMAAGAGRERLREAGAAYRSAFEHHRDAFVEPEDDEIRVIVGEASVRLIEMSCDAALCASERASRLLLRNVKTEPQDGLVAVAGRTVSLVVRVIGRS